jgi:hypothetical protein
MRKEEKLVAKYPTQLHDIEYQALEIVWEMARGNLHCPRDDERRNAMKVVKNLIKGNS